MGRSIQQLRRDWRELFELRRQGIAFPEVAPSGGPAERVFIGAVNSAGQGYRWARALETVRPGTAVTSARYEAEPSTFAYPVDLTVSSKFAAHSRRWQQRQRRSLLTYRAVLLESAQRPFSRDGGLGTVEQIATLQAAGVVCGLVFHGSDIRDPTRHIEAEANSHFTVDANFRARMEIVTARNREVVAQAAVPVFVSTVGLLSELEHAHWLPVVVDVDMWKNQTPPLQHEGPLRVVHAPSSSFVKGTELVEELLFSMHEKGEISYQQISGVPNREMPMLYREADVVIDHFRTGNYGVVACESFAAGRVTVSHVSQRERDRTRELTGTELPIVEATPETLREVLSDIRTRPEHYSGVAAQGIEFVREHHDGERSGRVLSEWIDGTHTP